jgi:hypothetical protein|tara:strand:+ start:267 stop:560 length:294 start_codon:yes stop_codon:yes gene_type:complete
MSDGLTFSEYHTNLRNTGLFITIAFGTMGYSEKFSNKLYRRSLIFVSLIFLIISGLLSLNLMVSDDDKRDIKLSIIPKILFGLTILLFLMGIRLVIK